jgi:hypothetical protein
MVTVETMVQKLRVRSRAVRLGILVGVVLAASATLCLTPPIPLWPGYHVFADQRTIFHIQHCFDVLSNVPFILVGVWGLCFLFGRAANAAFTRRCERIPYLFFFAGVAATGVGSAYYHLVPGNFRLIWDLLPMTVSFASIVAATIMERVSLRIGLWLSLPLIALGIASVRYWYLGELQGHGDIRFYLSVQFFPIIAIATIITLFPPRYTRTLDLFYVFIFYLIAKCFELLDAQIYSLGRIVGGHTLKHLTAGLACYWILRMLKLRVAIDDNSPAGRRLQEQCPYNSSLADCTKELIP